jgi:transposase-like protein
MRLILNRVLLVFIVNSIRAAAVRKLLKKQGFSPKLLITDKLRSHASALGRLGLSCQTHLMRVFRRGRAHGHKLVALAGFLTRTT